jgi:hypothetical protein
MILPPVDGGRIWKAERKVIVPITDGINIWNNFYMSWEFDGLKPPPQTMPFGSVKPNDSSLWYSTPMGWCRLKQMRRTIKWETGGISERMGWDIPGIPNNSKQSFDRIAELA